MVSSTIKNGKLFGILVSSMLFTASAAEQSRFRPIDKKRIEANSNAIKKYIEQTGSNVNLGQTFGKSAAYWTKGISYKAFEAMPILFFKDRKGKERAIEQLNTDQAIQYMNGTKTEFVEKYLLYPKAELKINTIAEFLHDKTVDNLSVPESEKNKLKQQPLLIVDYLHDTAVKEQYMNLTSRHICVQFFVEQEFGKPAN